MASPRATLRVIISPTAVDELHRIWKRNAERYGPSHADGYVNSLKRNIYDLAHRHGPGQAVSVRPDLRYIIIRRKAKGHGHVAVYRSDDKEVRVLHVFHTSQNWQALLAEEPLSE